MSDVSMGPEGERAATKRWNYTGAALIAIAFIGPSVASLGGLGNAFSVGQDLARTLGSFALLAIISWLIVRKKSDLSQAKARTVVGILLCITVGNNIASAAKEEAVAKQFLKEAFAFQAQHVAKFEDLGRRFDQITVNQYVTPEGLTSDANVAAGVAALERYRSLLQERNLLVQTYLAEYVAFIGKLPPGQARAGAESTLGANKEATEKLYGMLDKVQGEHAAALGAVFAWAQANSGKIGVRDGQLMFTSAAQQQELQALATRLQDAEKAVNEAAQKAQASQAEAIEKNERLQKEAAEFLAK
jgi:hypothetical protein